jgi:hypothetical protein
LQEVRHTSRAYQEAEGTAEGTESQPVMGDDLHEWSPWLKDMAISLGHDEALFEPPVCLICQETITGEVSKIEINEPNGLPGVKSTVSLCSEHGNVHPRFVRKRLEDYYA